MNKKVTEAINEIEGLLERCRGSIHELRESLAAAMRSMDSQSADHFLRECARLEIPDGVGVRAQELLKELDAKLSK